jgi:hypothetical protein
LKSLVPGGLLPQDGPSILLFFVQFFSLQVFRNSLFISNFK